MTMADRLIEALARASTRVYEPGAEAVSQLEHALQCADLAEAAGADEALVLACLLHDVGRFAADPALIADKARPGAPAVPGARGHHDVGADLIAPWVPERVAWCVRMHADGAGDAVALRRWDDQAKVAGKRTTPLADREALIRRWFARELGS